MGVEGIGAKVLRKEDRRFITGRGRYVDDMSVPGMKYAAFVRSPMARGRILEIDTRDAEQYFHYKIGGQHGLPIIGGPVGAGDGKGNEGKGSAKGHGASLGEKPPDGRHGTRRVSSNAPEVVFVDLRPLLGPLEGILGWLRPLSWPLKTILA